MAGKNRQRIAAETVVLDEGLPLDQVEHWIGLGYGLSAVGHRIVAFYLRDVDHRRLYQLAGCRSTVQYATVRFGMSRSEGRELLAAGHALRELRAIDEAFASGELCWSKVRLLVRVATPEHEERWLELARKLSIDELSLEVKLATKGDAPRDQSDRKGLPEVRLRIEMEVPPEVYARWEQTRRKLEAENGRPLRDWEFVDSLLGGDGVERVSGEGAGDEATGGAAAADASNYAVHVNLCAKCRKASVETEDGPVPVETARAEAIACTAPHVDVDGHKTPRLPSTAMRRRVHARDDWRCRACSARCGLQPHHVVSWEDGGPTTDENLVTLCRGCHTLAHAGLIMISPAEGPADGANGWIVEDKSGRDLRSPAESNGSARPVAEVLGDAMRHFNGTRRTRGDGEHGLPEVPLVRLEDIPAEIDGEWWRRHAHLLSWSDRTGSFTFEAGRPLDRGAVEASGTEADRPAAESDAMRASARARPRPARFADIVGQRAVIASLEAAVLAARKRDEAVGHVLLCGPPGLGKTTIARAVAAERGVGQRAASAALLTGAPALLGLLATLRKHDVLFLDEIHALPGAAAEVLYEAMEDGRVGLTINRGGFSRTASLVLEPFTLIGATTEEQLLPGPLVGRFRRRAHLTFYGEYDLEEIIRRAALREALDIDADATRALARVARHTPREALRLLGAVADEALIGASPCIDAALVSATLGKLGIDERGLGPLDRAYLDVLRERGPGRPLGVGRIAAVLGVSPAALERVHEPYLFRAGFATTTPNGRVALN